MDTSIIRINKALRWLILLALTASALTAAIGTIHWPQVGDSPLLQYVAFLIDHGKTPYRDIVEIDMPGTYALQWSAIHILGPGSLAWRFFDFSLLVAILASSIALTIETDWLAGFFAGSLFALIHFRDGPTHTGQRDLMMIATIFIACALLNHAVRRRRLRALILAGLFAGFAATIKPSGALFAAALIVLLFVRLRKNLGAPHLASEMWADPSHPSKLNPIICLITFLLTTAAAPLVCLLYLIQHDALSSFLYLSRGIIAYHASLGRPPLVTLMVGSFPSVLLATAIPAAILVPSAKPWRSWQGQLLLTGIVLGALSYIIQGKGFPYHRYPIEAFLCLLCAQILIAGLKLASWQRAVAIAGILLTVLYLAPSSAAIALRYNGRDQEFQHLLTADLNQLGGVALNNQVQCLEMAAECHTTLYTMQLVEATGYLYDCYMFQPTQTPVSLQYRRDFWNAITAHPPEVYVLTDQECFKTDRVWLSPRWPEFQHLLDTQYTLAAQRTPPHTIAWWRHPAVPFSYRLYVRRRP